VLGRSVEPLIVAGVGLIAFGLVAGAGQLGQALQRLEQNDAVKREQVGSATRPAPGRDVEWVRGCGGSSPRSARVKAVASCKHPWSRRAHGAIKVGCYVLRLVVAPSKERLLNLGQQGRGAWVPCGAFIGKGGE
jgi:hypothetical protein